MNKKTNPKIDRWKHERIKMRMAVQAAKTFFSLRISNHGARKMTKLKI